MRGAGRRLRRRSGSFGTRMDTSTSAAARAATTANAPHSPEKPAVSNSVGTSTAATVDPTQPQMPHTPMATPILSGRTHWRTTRGPHVVRMVRAAPSMARETTSRGAMLANRPTTEPATAMPQATTIMVFAPNRFASMPDGIAMTMLASVKTDMSHEAVWASRENCAISGAMMVGTLYWIMATATPATKSTMPTNRGFWWHAPVPSRSDVPAGMPGRRPPSRPFSPPPSPPPARTPLNASSTMPVLRPSDPFAPSRRSSRRPERTQAAY